MVTVYWGADSLTIMPRGTESLADVWHAWHTQRRQSEIHVHDVPLTGADLETMPLPVRLQFSSVTLTGDHVRGLEHQLAGGRLHALSLCNCKFSSDDWLRIARAVRGSGLRTLDLHWITVDESVVRVICDEACDARDLESVAFTASSTPANRSAILQLVTVNPTMRRVSLFHDALEWFYSSDKRRMYVRIACLVVWHARVWCQLVRQRGWSRDLVVELMLAEFPAVACRANYLGFAVPFVARLGPGYLPSRTRLIRDVVPFDVSKVVDAVCVKIAN